MTYTKKQYTLCTSLSVNISLNKTVQLWSLCGVLFLKMVESSAYRQREPEHIHSPIPSHESDLQLLLLRCVFSQRMEHFNSMLPLLDDYLRLIIGLPTMTMEMECS